MTRAIFDSRMMTRLEDFFPALCTIEQDEGITTDDYGTPIEDWQDFIVDIPCAHAPNGGIEVKQPDQTYVVSNYTLSLRGYYPTVTEKMRAVVDGTTYEILLVQSSSHGVTTRILTRTVT